MRRRHTSFSTSGSPPRWCYSRENSERPDVAHSPRAVSSRPGCGRIRTACPNPARRLTARLCARRGNPRSHAGGRENAAPGTALGASQFPRCYLHRERAPLPRTSDHPMQRQLRRSACRGVLLCNLGRTACHQLSESVNTMQAGPGWLEGLVVPDISVASPSAEAIMRTTISAERGRDPTRAPKGARASATAVAIAAGPPTMPDSAIPLIPLHVLGEGEDKCWISTLGISVAVGSRYSISVVVTIWPCSS